MPKDSERLQPWQSGRNQLAQHEGRGHIEERLKQGDSLEDILRELEELNHSSFIMTVYHINKAKRIS